MTRIATLAAALVAALFVAAGASAQPPVGCAHAMPVTMAQAQACAPHPQRPVVVRVDGGFDWGSAGIGVAAGAALSALVAGSTTVARRRRVATS